MFCKIQFCIEEKIKINELETHNENYKNFLAETQIDLQKEKTKINELESQCEILETTNAKLEKDNQLFAKELAAISIESTTSDSEEKIKEVEDKLEQAKQSITENLSKINELVSQCDNYKITNAGLTSDNTVLQEKLASSSKELALATSEFEQLQQSKLEADDRLTQKSKQIEDGMGENEITKESLHKLNVELESFKQEMQEEKIKYDQLQTKCATVEVENTNLVADLRSLEDKYLIKEQSCKKEHESLNLNLEQTTRVMEAQKSVIEKLQLECSLMENKTKQLSETLDSEKEKYAVSLQDQETNTSSLKSQLDELNNEYTVEKSNYAKLAENYKTLDAAFVAITDECGSLRNEKINLEEKLAQTTVNEAENIQAEIVPVLQKCEFHSSNKIKELVSASERHLVEMTDVKRQMQEKENYIEELEKGLSDNQKLGKEREATLNQQIFAIKQQHSVEVEELMHLKKLAEAENYKLKLAENKKTIKRTSSNASKVSRKRSISDASKEEEEDKENFGRDTDIVKEENDSTDTAEVEIPKKRRALRSKQRKAYNEESDDDEFVPKTKEPRKQAQKKKDTEKPRKLAPARTSRRKLQEDTENVSPVKKVMTYMNSKIRSVAQSVSNIPSPRVTRQRKKLFNCDAECAGALDKKWKL